MSKAKQQQNENPGQRDRAFHSSLVILLIYKKEYYKAKKTVKPDLVGLVVELNGFELLVGLNDLVFKALFEVGQFFL